MFNSSIRRHEIFTRYEALYQNITGELPMVQTYWLQQGKEKYTDNTICISHHSNVGQIQCLIHQIMNIELQLQYQWEKILKRDFISNRNLDNKFSMVKMLTFTNFQLREEHQIFISVNLMSNMSMDKIHFLLTLITKHN